MSVTTTVSSILYNTDGVTKSYNVPFYFIQPNDLLVQTSDGKTYSLNTDYTVDGITDLFGDYNNGAILNFNIAPANALQLLIQRVTSRTQPIALLDGQPYSADTINHALDKLTLIAQEGFVSGYKGIALAPPISAVVSYNVGDWFKNANFVPGGIFGWVCTTAGAPGVWEATGPISLV